MATLMPNDPLVDNLAVPPIGVYGENAVLVNEEKNGLPSNNFSCKIYFIMEI